ncbi:MAG: hypothetical protein P8Z39_07425, partial [Gammaproteobacteria bacterium]
ALTQSLVQIDGVETVFDRPVFHEQVVRLPLSAQDVLHTLSTRNIQGGYDLSKEYPELSDAVLVCATEKRTQDEINLFAEELDRVVQMLQQKNSMAAGEQELVGESG